MADFAANLRSLAAMLAAEKAVQDQTNHELEVWIAVFLVALVPFGTRNVAPDVGRAAHSRPEFNEDAIVLAAVEEWRKRYKSQRKSGYSQAAEDRYAFEVRQTVRLIPDRAFGVAQDVIRAGIKSGQSVPEILDAVEVAVRESVPLTSDLTGRLVGPTAINDATLAAYGDLENIDGEGPYVKTWVNLFDGRTRPSHLDAGADPLNDRIPLSRKFVVGDGELCDYPRDDSLSIGEKANCRCIAAVELA